MRHQSLLSDEMMLILGREGEELSSHNQDRAIKSTRDNTESEKPLLRFFFCILV